MILSPAQLRELTGRVQRAASNTKIPKRASTGRVVARVIP